MQRSIFRMLLRYSAMLISVICFSGCEDIFEKNISSEDMNLITPPSGYVSQNGQITFTWEEVPDAIEYELQVVSPNWSSPVEYPLDSTLGTNRFVYSFVPGQYEWRIRAKNGSSSTDYKYRTFHVDTASTLSGLNLTLLEPSANYVGNDEVLTFSWQDELLADNYTFQLFENNNGVAGITAGDPVTTTSNELEYEINEGDFIWKLYAANSLPSISNNSERRVIIDRTAPTSPVATYPLNESIDKDTTQTFMWNSGVDALTPTTDSVFIYQDLLQLILLYQDESSSSDLALDLSGWNNGTYYWKIKTQDAALNQSVSNLVSFDLE